MKYRRMLKSGGANSMEENGRKKLDLSFLKSKTTITVSSKEALKDVTPINWSKEVLTGKRKVIVS